MSRYLRFDSSGFHFLLNIDYVVEVFDAMASVESIEKVLVGKVGEVYWRGKLARMLHFNQLLQQADMLQSHCYVVCALPGRLQQLLILQVDGIHALHDIHNNDFRPVSIHNPKLLALSGSVYLDPVSQQLVFLVDDLERLFTGDKAA